LSVPGNAGAGIARSGTPVLDLIPPSWYGNTAGAEVPVLSKTVEAVSCPFALFLS
jgi:hypothetical protein